MFESWKRLVRSRPALLATISLAALLHGAGQGVAADSDMTGVADWSGFYGGFHAGYGFTKFGGSYAEFSDLSRNIQDPFLDGLVVGGQIGYNFQTGAWVYGLEGDLSYSDQSFSFVDDNGDREKGRIDVLASLRGRLGIATGPALVYLTGGLAYGHASFEAIASPTDRGKRKNSAIGGVIGGGLEYRLSPMISLRGEALHYMFYDRKDIRNLTGSSDDEDRWEFRDDTVFRVGLNVHLNGTGNADAAYVPVAAPADWSGFYGGIHVGYGFSKFGGSYDEAGDLPKNLQDPFLDGVIAGGQIGYNFQSGAWVYGLELDMSYSDQSFSFIDDEGDRQKGRIDALGSLRGRLGIATGPALVYLTGGLAYGHASFEAIEGPGNSGKRKNSAIGGVIGGGLEYRLSPMVSLRGEALHYMFYDKKDILNLTFDSDDEDRWEFRNNTVFRIGLNVHLNGM